MTTLRELLRPPVNRLQHWLHLGVHPGGEPHLPEPAHHEPAHHEPSTGLGVDPTPGPGHAPGHRHLGPPPEVPRPAPPGRARAQHHPAWLDTGGRVDRQRRNERHGDEKE